MRTVVGVEKRGQHDWMDAYGHYWAWDEAAGHWNHDRARCHLSYGDECVAGPRETPRAWVRP